MCGFVGWSLAPGVSRPVEQLRAMLERIGHRGPDDRGLHELPRQGIAMAHARLSIIDLSERGRQPMIGPGGGVLSYNGELYNFRALRGELASRGHEFVSQTDSEVLLQSLERWGEAALPRLCGMFAFAAWLPTEDALVLARDPLGMKPLYYAELPRGEGVVFASEVKAFGALDDLPLEVDPTALRAYLELGYTYTEHETIFRGVRKVPPGHRLLVRWGRASAPVPYFDARRLVRDQPQRWDEDDTRRAADQLESTLEEVVNEHLVADVPLALLLSGGLDSSLLAAFASRARPVHTVTMHFASSDIDERPYARQVAEALGTQHDEMVISPRQTAEGLVEVCRYFDDLFADWGLVSTRVLYHEARRRGIKVILVGEGADELFAGYSVFDHASGLRGAPSLSLFALYRHYSGQRYGRQFPRFRRTLQDLLAATGGELVQAVRLFEVRNQLPNNFVMKVDKASMSVSVEARAPYLDRRVAELALRLPTAALLANGENKHVLREVARRQSRLPRAIADRRKYGASIAMGWMDDSAEFRAFARDVLLRKGGWSERLGLDEAMRAYFDRGRSGYPFPHAISIFRNLAWRLMLLELWSTHYLRREVQAA